MRKTKDNLLQYSDSNEPLAKQTAAVGLFTQQSQKISAINKHTRLKIDIKNLRNKCDDLKDKMEFFSNVAAIGLVGIATEIPPLMLAGAAIFLTAIIGYISTLMSAKSHKKRLAKLEEQEIRLETRALDCESSIAINYSR